MILDNMIITLVYTLLLYTTIQNYTLLIVYPKNVLCINV